jgi:heterodisulfide reductase subunit A
VTDSILLVGGGIAGLHAALECANSGARAIVVERGPVVGGRLAATMLEPSAIGDRSEGVRTPLFEALVENENIEILTNSTLQAVEGRPGNFTVTVREEQRFVTDACTRCKKCHTVCPVVLPNEADAGLTYRKAIYTPMLDTLPEAWVIDIENCLNTPPNYLPCQRCVDVCDDDAIFFNLPAETIHTRHVGAVILAPGFRTEEPTRFNELGYGEHTDIVTSAPQSPRTRNIPRACCWCSTIHRSSRCTSSPARSTSCSNKTSKTLQCYCWHNRMMPSARQPRR